MPCSIFLICIKLPTHSSVFRYLLLLCAYTTIIVTRWQLIHTIERQLLSEHLSGILGKGLEALMDGPRLADLTTLYSLFSRVKEGLSELCNHFNAYIKVG